MHGLPVTLRDVALLEMKLAGQVTGSFPLTGFLRQHQLIERAQAAGSAEQDGLGFLIDGYVIEEGVNFLIGKPSPERARKARRD